MKTNRLSRLAAIGVALLMLALAALPAAAGNHSALAISDHDAEKLTAFWNQEAYNGLTNGEAVYDHEWPEVNYYFGFDPNTMHYEGGYDTELLTMTDTGEFFLRFGYSVPYYIVDYSDGDPLFVDGEEEVFPDLYGELDLAGTGIQSIARGEGIMDGQTHISALELDDCPSLNYVYFNGQHFCRSIDAVNCPNLEYLNAQNCACTHIAFSPKEFEAPVVADTLGLGAIGAEYLTGTVKLYAYPEIGRFIGWYVDGECVSADAVFTCEEGAEIVAYFGGDADSNGVIDSTDALLLLRAAMGLAPEVELNDADVNNDGAIDSADALAILRLAMGI